MGPFRTRNGALLPAGVFRSAKWSKPGQLREWDGLNISSHVSREEILQPCLAGRIFPLIYNEGIEGPKGAVTAVVFLWQPRFGV